MNDSFVDIADDIDMQLALKKRKNLSKDKKTVTFHVKFQSSAENMLPPLCGFLKPVYVIRLLLLYYMIQAICKIPLNLYFRFTSSDDQPHAITLQAMVTTLLTIFKICTIYNFTLDDFSCPTCVWAACTILDVASLLLAITVDYTVSKDMPDSN